MKKKITLITVILLIVSTATWAIFNQKTQPKSNLDKNQNNLHKKQTIPGGSNIIEKKLPSNQNQNLIQDGSQPQTSNNNSQEASSSASSTNNHQTENSNQKNKNSSTSPSNTSSSNPSQPSIPPVTPPNPPQPPSDPGTPPTPPNPPTNPSNPDLTDQQKAQKLSANLKSPANQNVAQFTNDDGEIRTVLWTKGITAPRLGAGGDFRRVAETHGSNQFITYATLYRDAFLSSGWYDVDKQHGSSVVDRNLCFGAVAANQLHWWMNYHKSRVQQFLTKTNYANTLPPSQAGTFKDLRIYPDSFLGQQNSKFFDMFKLYFGNNNEGYYADPLVDMFINGHKPKSNAGYNDPDWTHNFQMDPRGGFFHAVFDKRNITRRLTPSNFSDFSSEMKKAFRAGESVGIIHHTSGQSTHIITAWGLEYDLDGNLVGIYITDSDDQDDHKTNGMKRYGIRNINNKAFFSNNITNPRAGSLIYQISTLGLGEDKWQEYLK